MHSLPELIKQLRPRLHSDFRFIYQPQYVPAEHFEQICRLVAAITECTLAIDEVQELCSGASDPMNGEFGFLARCGRHKGVEIVFTSQRPADVPRALTSKVQNLIVFRLEDRADLDYFRAKMPREKLTALSQLPNRYFFARDEQYNWQLCRPI